MRRPLILLLVIAALAPTSAMASEWFRCRADGETRQACCCPQTDQEEPEREAPDKIGRASCCDIDRTEAQTSDVRGQADRIAFAGLAVIPQEMSCPPVVPEARRIDVGATPAKPRGPPSLFLRNCSLLL